MESSWMENFHLIPSWIGSTFAFVIGAIVGSFLNVCIHRMPRDESIVNPRSHCYSCGKMIPWYHNIPLLSYFLLGGKCHFCKAKFSIRYWMVELLTALLWLWVWRTFPWDQAIVYMIFVSGLIAATFIDFEHYIIPNEITLGGVLAGIICSGLVPSLQLERLHSYAALWSLSGAFAGYFSLWAVVEIGKKVFGVKKVRLSQPTQVLLTSEGITMDDAMDRWEDIFSRESDTLSFEAKEIQLGEKKWEQALVRVNYQQVMIQDEVFPFENFAELRGTTELISIPREAMGFGDVKFLAAIGAFLGPKSIFFVILFSSLTGSVVGLTTMMIGKREWGLKLPYGPYLAFAALLWLFGGHTWIAQYIAWLER
jgi:leader peptidase (prepilin peptidase)/N-methyltransferase